MNKHTVLLALIFVINSFLSAQPQLTKLFSSDYESLNISLRITNSGIYGLKNFAVNKEGIVLSTEKGLEIVNFKGKIISFESNPQTINTKNKEILSIAKSNNFIPDYLTEPEKLNYSGGTYSNGKDVEIIFNVKNPSLLEIKFSDKTKRKTFDFNFNNNLAYAGLIGIDKKGNYFISVEKFLSQIPLKVEREIWTLNPEGKILTVLKVPTIKYLTFDNEICINAEGELFHLITEPDGITLVKWTGLTQRRKEIVQYPNYLQKFVHYDYFTTKKEIATKPGDVPRITVSTTRAEVLRRGEEYVEHKYYCTSKNLAPNGATAPDGDAVKTPSWLRIGWNARIPYKWGGFNTVWGFDHDLAQGEYAGDINTGGVSGYAVGVDCSGYVSRCWGLTYHASTAYMPNITNKYNSWADLKPGDAVHKVGHVRLFVKHNSDGSLRIVEASGRNWDVSYWSYKPSDLGAYSPRYYIGMTSKSSEKSLRLIEALKSGDQINLKWTCDSTGVLGYRIYETIDGKNWVLIATEDSVKEKSFSVHSDYFPAFFRVSAVTASGGDYAESNWSNPMGVGINGAKKYLVVDGFNRDYGSASWQGDGNPFAVAYGFGLDKAGVSFESAKNQAVISGDVNLENYDGVFWYDGDESTVDETFNSTEQSLIKNYLESGGRLFVSGSEIGWDLDHKGDAADKDFYKNYFKAVYAADDALTNRAEGADGTVFQGLDFNFGQTYTEEYPDVITPNGGSSICLKYNNGLGAGVSYTGSFGNSSDTGKVIYFAFGPESTADDSVLYEIVNDAVNYFEGNTSVANNILQPEDFKIFNPYPNPFGRNSASHKNNTTLSFTISRSAQITVKIYNVLGQLVATLLNKRMTAGFHSVKLNSQNLTAGVYFLQTSVNKKINVRKIVLIK